MQQSPWQICIHKWSCTSSVIAHNRGARQCIVSSIRRQHMLSIQNVLLCEVCGMWSITALPCPALPCPALPCPALPLIAAPNLSAALGPSDSQSLACSVLDLEQGGWEWTCTPFAPLKGFEAMSEYPEYSTDFFDDCHYVVKGSSPYTHASLIRRSFRNYYQKEYPYVFAKFRMCKDAE